MSGSANHRTPALAGFRLSGKVEGRPASYQLESGENRLGSAPSNEVVLAESGVSRYHATLQVGSSSLTLRDLDSKNGTFVNGRRVRSAAVVPGDELGFGRVRLRLAKVDPQDAEIAFEVSLGAFAKPSTAPVRDTTRVISGSRRLDPLYWLQLVERLGERLCLAPNADLGGALTELVQALHLLAAFLVEIPPAGEATVLTSAGELDDDALEAGRAAWAEHLRQREEGGQRERFESFRAAGKPAVAGALVQRPDGVFFGLLLVGERNIGNTGETLLRSVVRWIDRLRTRVPGPPVAEPPSKLGSLQFPEGYVVGTSAAMTALYAQMEPLVVGDLPVLIAGETGVGKEYLARILHVSSARVDGPFVAINCAAIPADLLEAELFGIEKGVATGVSARQGKFQLAAGGTLLLDEVGDMSTRLQAKLLRALQEKEIHPVGGTPIKTDVRLVSCTNTKLQARAAEGTFRIDLYYRLAGFTLRVPPLRERRDDVPVLVEHFTRGFATEIGKPIRGVTVKLLRKLMDYDWPGNVRELEHEIRRLVYACHEAQPIDSSLLSPTISGAPPWLLSSGSQQQTDDFNLAHLERHAIERALASSSGKLVAAARLLGISRDALRRRIERHGLAVQSE